MLLLCCVRYALAPALVVRGAGASSFMIAALAAGGLALV